jgi:hypothetical protein
LNKDQTKRLGTKADYSEIKAHPWFADIDFDKLYKKEVNLIFQKSQKKNKIKIIFFFFFIMV